MARASNVVADAVALHQAGDLVQAIALYRQALKHHPKHAALQYNLGTALQARGEHVAAEQALRKACEIESDDLRFRKAWTASLREVGKAEESLKAWRDSIARNPRAIEPRVELARSLSVLRRIDEAIAAYHEVFAIDAAHADAMADCARLLLRIGRRDDARALVERALSVVPDHGEASVLLARLDAQSAKTDAAKARLERVMNGEAGATARGRASLELASMLEKAGDYDRAFSVVEQGQAALFSRLSPGERDLTPPMLVIRACREQITREVVAKWKPPPTDQRRDPIFIVGFPRSGTTLLEQMLSVHPNLVVTDELPLIQRVKDATVDRLKVRQEYPQSLSVLGERQLSILRDVYFDSAREMIGDAALQRRIVDKSPLNTVDLCVVRRLFPDARVIVALRDPRDTVLSSFFQAFARGTPHFYGFESTAQLYAGIMDLWLHYRDALGLRWMELRYEDMVADPADKARQMIEFIREPWTDAILQFHAPQHRRFVTTPSFDDVARPVYRTSVKRWEHYRGQFECVRPLLERFVHEFGYGAW